MRWMAVLICRLPERHARRRPLVEPDHCGMGARPPYLAKALSLGKRSTLAASAINLAAVNSAQPGTVGSVEPRSLIRRTMRAVIASMFSLNRLRSVTSSRASSACKPICSLR